LAPVSKAKFKTTKQLHVSTYGGGLWHTWFDRDLILTGRVVYKDGEKFTSKLWESKKPILKIPNLAIHLRTERNKFEPNTESELRPIFSSTIHEDIARETLKSEAKILSKHDEALIDLISTDIGVKPEDILDMDLYFADSQKSDFVGLNDDFISSPRLDNLFSSFYSNFFL
jgi:aspartyl aminopeptidase